MEWLVLLLLIPATIVPIVLLFGFAGCAIARPCQGDGDCPLGSRCVQGSCVAIPAAGTIPPSAPEALQATAVSDSAIELSWTTDEPAVRSFQVERVEEGTEDDFAPIADPTAQTYQDTGREEGTTYLYQVRAFDGQEFSEPSDQIAATTFPAAPSNLVATPVAVDRIDLSWTNASARATRFSLERRTPGAPFAEIDNITGTTYSDAPLPEGRDHEYRVIALIPTGFQNGIPQEVRSAPSAPVSARTWTVAFSATLVDSRSLPASCLIQTVTAAQFASFSTLLNTIGTQVRITVRSSGSLTINRIYLSRVAASGDQFDSDAADLTRVVDIDLGDPAVVLPGSASLVLGPINYPLDRTQDLLVAFDLGDAANVMRVTPGGDHFLGLGQQASVADRSLFLPGGGQHHLIERIEVL